jgi:hypothetical protein
MQPGVVILVTKVWGITMTGCMAISHASLFANSNSKSERRKISTPTRGGDAFGKELTRDRSFASLGWNLFFEGLLFGVSLYLRVKATSCKPRKLGPRVSNTSTQCKGGSAVFCRKSETLEVAR